MSAVTGAAICSHDIILLLVQRKYPKPGWEIFIFRRNINRRQHSDDVEEKDEMDAVSGYNSVL